MNYILLSEIDTRDELWKKIEQVNDRFQLEDGGVYLTRDEMDQVDREVYIDGNDVYLFEDGLMALFEKDKKLIFLRNKNSKKNNEVTLVGDGTQRDITFNDQGVDGQQVTGVLTYITHTTRDGSVIDKLFHYQLTNKEAEEKGDIVDSILFEGIDTIDEYTAIVDEMDKKKIVYYRVVKGYDDEDSKILTDTLSIQDKQLDLILNLL